MSTETKKGITPPTAADIAAKGAQASPASPPPPAEPALGPDGKLPLHLRKRRWGGIEHPEADFIRVTFLADGSIGGERFTKGRSADVPKAVFAMTLKPNKQAKLYEKPQPPPAQVRPATDKGNFKRVTR
jgi:hypothetical protein